MVGTRSGRQKNVPEPVEDPEDTAGEDDTDDADDGPAPGEGEEQVPWKVSPRQAAIEKQCGREGALAWGRLYGGRQQMLVSTAGTSTGGTGIGATACAVFLQGRFVKEDRNGRSSFRMPAFVSSTEPLQDIAAGKEVEGFNLPEAAKREFEGRIEEFPRTFYCPDPVAEENTRIVLLPGGLAPGDTWQGARSVRTR